MSFETSESYRWRTGSSSAGLFEMYETIHDRRLRLLREFTGCNHKQRLNILSELLRS